VSDYSPEHLLAVASDVTGAVRTAASYQIALGELAMKPQLGNLAQQIADQNEEIANLSGEAWRNWSFLLPDRLSENDRAALGDYAAILRTISTTTQAGSSVSAQVWRRYRHRVNSYWWIAVLSNWLARSAYY
jgi:hypothetical protein